jgi:hypothetical protein
VQGFTRALAVLRGLVFYRLVSLQKKYSLISLPHERGARAYIKALGSGGFAFG